MNVVLTGATGFIGSHVMDELLGHGHEVTAVVRDDAQADSALVRRRRCSRDPARFAAGRRRQPHHAGNGQHWSTVHVADLADFFRRVLEDKSAAGRYVVGNGSDATVAELTEAAADAVGAPGAVPGSDDEAKARLGDYFAEVLLLDQGTKADKARHDVGWSPSHPSLVDEFREGSYQKLWAAARSRRTRAGPRSRGGILA